MAGMAFRRARISQRVAASSAAPQWQPALGRAGLEDPLVLVGHPHSAAL